MRRWETWSTSHLEITWDSTTSTKLPKGSNPANPVVFDIKTTFLAALRETQFSRKESEYCNAHLTHILEACNIINLAGVSESDKRLLLVVYSPSEWAKDWLNALPSDNIATWGQLKKWFLYWIFPATKDLERHEILNFQQEDRETLFDAWERYKLLLKRYTGNTF